MLATRDPKRNVEHPHKSALQDESWPRLWTWDRKVQKACKSTRAGGGCTRLSGLDMHFVMCVSMLACLLACSCILSVSLSPPLSLSLSLALSKSMSKKHKQKCICTNYIQQKQTNIHTHIHTCLPTCIPTYIRTCVLAYIRTYVYEDIWPCFHTYIQQVWYVIPICARIHIVNTYVYVYIYIYTYIYM